MKVRRLSALALGALPLLADAARPLNHYPSEPAPLGSRPGLRRYRHSEAHRLPGGGDAALAWEVDANPDEFMSLDLTHADGARVLDCGPTRLRLWIPAQHIGALRSWRHIVASGNLHGCQHLGRWQHLYHRIVRVDGVNKMREGATVLLTTEELAHPTEMFSHIKVFFRMMPGEAKRTKRDSQPKRKLSTNQDFPYPEMDGPSIVVPTEPPPTTTGPPPSPTTPPSPTNPSWWPAADAASPAVVPVQTPPPSIASAKFHDMLDSLGNVIESSDPNIEYGFDETNEEVKSLFNLDKPQSLSQVGWNWDYDAKTVRNPEFALKYPGGDGWLRLYKPYLKARFGITLNFTSDMNDIFEAPHVHIVTDISGFADMSADIASAMSFDQDTKLRVSSQGVRGPLGLFNFIGNESLTLHPFTLDVGGMPISIEPGFSCHVNAFHVGQLKGSLRVGLKSKLLVDGRLSFDTKLGLKTNLTVKAVDVTLTPPTWMLFTRHFELGLELAPEIWLRGGLGPMKDMEFGLGLRPYMNVSLMQKGQENALGRVGLHSFGDMNDFIIYPFRVSGLPHSLDSFAIKVTANGISHTTYYQMNLGGVIEYNGLVKEFLFGSLTDAELIGKEIVVDILKEGENLPIATGTAFCQGLVHGECSPSPLRAELSVEGHLVRVLLSTAWQASPLIYLLEKMRGISYAVPQVTLSEEASAIVASQDSKVAEWRFERNGRTYSLPLTVDATDEKRVVLTSFSIYDLGCRFLDGWKATSVLPADDPQKPHVRLVVNDVTIGTGTLPPVNWQQPLSSLTMSNAFNEGQLIPIDVSLVDLTNGGSSVGEGRMEMLITGGASAAYWIYPYRSEDILAGTSQRLYWTIHVFSSRYAGFQNKQVNFTVSSLIVSGTGTFSSSSWSQTLYSQCDRNSDIDVHLYADTDPCVFSADVILPPDLSGQSIVFLMEWTDSNAAAHKMMSVPVRVLSSNTRRLFGLVAPRENTPHYKNTSKLGPDMLSADAVSEREEQTRRWDSLDGFGQNDRLVRDCDGCPEAAAPSAGHARRTQSIASWSQTSADGHGAPPVTWEHSELAQCDRAPLKYAFGFGVVAKNDIKNVFIPDEVPTMGGNSFADQFHSGYFSVLQRSQGSPLEKVLPKGFCAGGLCQGELPGCKPERVNPVDIKQIVFKLSRSFQIEDYVGNTARAQELRRAVAYGLSVLPDAILMGEEAMEEAKDAASTLPPTTTRPTTLPPITLPPVMPRIIPQTTRVQEGTTRVQEVTTRMQDGTTSTSTTTALNYGDSGNAFETAGAAVAGAALQSDDPQSGFRRLDGRSKRETKSLVVTVTKPMLYKFNEQLIEEFINRGAFNLIADGREDVLGPVRIESFYLRESPLKLQKKLVRQLVPLYFGAAVLAGAAVAATLAIRAHGQCGRSTRKAGVSAGLL